LSAHLCTSRQRTRVFERMTVKEGTWGASRAVSH